MFIVIHLVLRLLSFGFILIEETRKAKEPIGFNSQVKNTIVECVLFRDKQLCEKGFFKAEYSLDFEGFIAALV